MQWSSEPRVLLDRENGEFGTSGAVAGDKASHAQTVQRLGVVLVEHAFENQHGPIRGSAVQQQLSQVNPVLCPKRAGIPGLKRFGLSDEQSASPASLGGISAFEQRVSERAPAAVQGLVKTMSKFKILKSSGAIAERQGQLTQAHVRLGVTGFEFEHPAILFRSLIRATQIFEQSPKVDERFHIARILPKLSEEQLACALESAGSLIRAGELCVQLREIGLPRSGFPKTRQRLVHQISFEQSVGHGRERACVLVVDHLADVELSLGFIEVAQSGVRLDQVHRWIDVALIQCRGSLEPGGGILQAIEPERVDAGHQVGHRVVGLKLQSLLGGFDRGVIPTGGLERERKVEVPLRLVRVQRERFAEFRLRFVVAAALEALVRLLYESFSIKPVAHAAALRPSLRRSLGPISVHTINSMSTPHARRIVFQRIGAVGLGCCLAGCLGVSGPGGLARSDQNPVVQASAPSSVVLTGSRQVRENSRSSLQARDAQPSTSLPAAQTNTADAAGVLANAEAEPVRWRSAAEWLLGRPDDPEARDAIFDSLKSDSLSGPRAEMLAAIASRSTVPESFLPVLERLLKRTPPTARSPVLAAIGSVRSRKAADLLVQSTPPSVEPTAREAAFRALIRMTGRESLGWSAQAWEAWHDEHRQLSEREWSMMIVRGLADRADDLESEDNQHTEQIIGLYDRLMDRTPPEERSELIAEMLVAPQSEVRAAGVRRGSLEHALGRTPGRPVEDAIILLLGSDDPWARKDAATLALAIGAEATAEAVVQAVANEQTPEVVEVLLRAASRWPRPELVEPVLTWLASGDQTRTAAAEAATSLAGAGLLTPSARAWIGALLRRAEIEDLAQVELSLLVSVGEPGDLRRVADVLDDPEHPARLPAAEALVLRSEGVEPLINAARTDGTLVPLAADAILRHRSSRAGLEALLSLHSSGDTSAATRRLVRELTLEELISAASQDARTPAERSLLLDDLPTRDILPQQSGLFRQGLELLALARLEMNEPQQALIAIESLPVSADGVPAEETALRTRVLILLNRLEDARRAGAPLEVWQAAIEEIREEPHAEAAEALMRSIFALENDSGEVSEPANDSTEFEEAPATDEQVDTDDSSDSPE